MAPAAVGGCAIIAFAAVDLLCLVPLVFENLLWNAYFPIPFFIAAIVLAWVVGSGSFGWWPVLVFVASVAAQCHLVFAVPSLVLALGAPLVGLALAGRPRRLRFVVVGLVVGLACWLAPLLQNLGPDGNLTALAQSGGDPTLGAAFGLRMVATAASPWPIWLHSEPSNYFSVLAFITRNSPVYGAFVLGLLAVITVAAWRFGRRSLCALAAVALGCTASVLVTFTVYPQKNGLNLDYLIVLLWVVGILVWTTVAWSAVVGVSVLVRRRRAVDPVDPAGRAPVGWPRRRDWSPWPSWSSWPWPASARFVRSPPRRRMSARDRAAFDLVGTIGNRIEHAARPGPVAIRVVDHSTDEFLGLWITEGVAWKLESDGWSPGVYSLDRAFTGLTPAHRSPAFVVTLDGESLVSVTPARCSPAPAGCTAGLR